MADKTTLDPLDIADDVLALAQLGAAFAAGSKEAAAVQLGARLGALALAAIRKLADAGVSLDDFRVPETLDEHVALILQRRGIEP